MSGEGWNSVSSQDLNSWFNPQRDLVIQRFQTDDWDETREDESIYKLGDWMNEMDGVNAITGMSIKDMDELKKDLLDRPMFNNAIDITTSTTTSTENPVTPSSVMSNDSLTFFLVYCSIFTLTILYIGVKFSKNWRKRRLLLETLAEEDPPVQGRCNHAICRQAQEVNHLLPYTRFGAMLLPGLMNIETGRPGSIAGPLHNTISCNNSCENCQKLSLPPPSYTKLFLDETPPSYTDAVTMEPRDALNTAFIFETSEINETASTPFLVRVTELQENSTELGTGAVAKPVAEPQAKATNETNSTAESGTESTNGIIPTAESETELRNETEVKNICGAESKNRREIVKPRSESVEEPVVGTTSESNPTVEPATESTMELEPGKEFKPDPMTED